MRTFYGVHWWLKDNSDFREIDSFTTQKQAIAKARTLANNGNGYHSFIIYAYHAELANDDFIEDDRIYKRQKWEKIDDDFEKLCDIEGKTI